jgi:hypothetical protein
MSSGCDNGEVLKCGIVKCFLQSVKEKTFLFAIFYKTDSLYFYALCNLYVNLSVLVAGVPCSHTT